jgi:hypothetical protein
MRIWLLVLFAVYLFIPTIGIAQSISEHLILQDIGQYKLDKPEKIFAGEPPIGGPRTYDIAGVIKATGHFPDHTDKTYEVMYIGGNGLPSPTVEVTVHAGGDSDKWLLHEVEDSYRSSSDEKLGLLTYGTILRKVNSNRVIWIGWEVELLHG